MPTDVTKPAKRPGRPRRDQPGLTRQAILTAALALVDEHGLDTLSMRRLASELGVDPMSIYHHLPNKAAIVSGLVGEVFSRMPLELPAGTWQERVRAWAEAYRGLARAHPNLVLQIVTDSAAVSEAAIAISEPLYAALDAAGLAAAEVIAAADTIVDFVNGNALGAAAPGGPDQLAERLAARDTDDPDDADTAPTMRRVHAAGRVTAGFDAGIEIILRGLRR
ncbi:TetR/AcrR family transcriptional regulator [Pseudonocardia sp. TRM90224]|uniref:TetR/AcrR family transcriptional regulator n=1 Tax=Pseudonocardia sp. TRM90224 TaxID=2812678 RepID=UPI001E5BFB54|nr:TetR/AcrR family transcriptional regulator C-terminal domain-containing protein [Pseudonocardia sp. TRM90224]